MQVPLLELKLQYKYIQQDIKEAVAAVLESQQFIMGPQVSSLEERVGTYVGSKNAIAVASGSDALLISLMAIGIKPGDAVITTTYTFFATAGAVSRLNAVPVFVDIDPKTYNIDPQLIEEILHKKSFGQKIKAIIPVHLFGQSAEMNSIMDIARRHNLIVIEDAAQAIGAEYDGKKTGSMGEFGCFSFFPSKNLGAYGDGGLVVTDNDEFAEKLRILRLHGSRPKYHHKFIGLNSRLDNIQAAVLEVKLKHIDKWNEGRILNAEWYNKKFAEAGLIGDFINVPYSNGCGHVYNQYVIRAGNRDGLAKHLKNNGVGCEIYYPIPLHLQECYKNLGYKEGDFPISEFAAKETLALPVYPELSMEQKEYVVENVRKFYGR